MNIQPPLPQAKIKFDWKAYYQRFAEKHGGNPIVYKGRQLFSDGWTYSLTDYAGPEYPPPQDKKELLTLQKVYWYTRWNRARNELEAVKDRFRALKGLQANKDVPLQQVVVNETIKEVNGEEKKFLSRSSTDWSPDLFAMTILYLEDEVNTADNHLKELKAQTPESNNGERTTAHAARSSVESTPDEPPDVARPDSHVSGGTRHERNADEPGSVSRKQPGPKKKHRR